MSKSNKETLLCVANYDSAVGYAWWLMESFWVAIDKKYSHTFNTALAYPSISKIPKSIEESNLQIHHFSFSNSSRLSIVRQLKFIKKLKVKTLYFSDWPTSSWRYIFYRAAGVKSIIIHDHTPGLRTKPRGLKKIIKSLRSRIPGINCDAAIGATDFVCNRLHEVACLPLKKCFSAQNGINTVSDLDTIEKKLPIRDSISYTTLLISTGRANTYKGVEFALKTVHELVINRGYTGLHYLYCGEGPHLEMFRDQSRKMGIENNVSLPGRVNNIPQILPICDIAFHPSKGEVGYSLSILEYMQAQLPVVVPDNPSVCGATTHDETGLIYKEDDIESAANQIEKLIKDPTKRIQLGKKAEEIQKEYYQLQHTHEALLRVFSKVLGK